MFIWQALVSNGVLESRKEASQKPPPELLALPRRHAGFQAGIENPKDSKRRKNGVPTSWSIFARLRIVFVEMESKACSRSPGTKPNLPCSKDLFPGCRRRLPCFSRRCIVYLIRLALLQAIEGASRPPFTPVTKGDNLA